MAGLRLPLIQWAGGVHPRPLSYAMDNFGAYDRNGKPISQMEWSRLMMDHEYKRVALDKVGDADVSTVWLGLDHNFSGTGPPLIFETMIFGGPHHDEQWRWSTLDEAIAGHASVVAALTFVDVSLP